MADEMDRYGAIQGPFARGWVVKQSRNFPLVRDQPHLSIGKSNDEGDSDCNETDSHIALRSTQGITSHSELTFTG